MNGRPCAGGLRAGDAPWASAQGGSDLVETAVVIPRLILLLIGGAGNQVEVWVAYLYNVFIGCDIGLDALTIRA